MMQSDKTSSRPIRVVGLLLILQVIGLIGIIAYSIEQVPDWQQVHARLDLQEEGLELEIQPDSPEQQAKPALEADRAILVAILFTPSIILASIGALGFILFSRRGWLLASLAQTLSLGVCLELYYEPFWDSPVFVYPVMVYCILMILYLNSSEVRVVFHSRPKPLQNNGMESGGGV
jgi:hypothetical protein